MEARNLVLVLVGHQLEELAGDRLGHFRATRRALPLRHVHPADELGPAARPVDVLIGHELGYALLGDPAQVAAISVHGQ